jgi:hypothetical protein
MKNSNLRASIASSFVSANNAYIARNGVNAVLNKNGMQADIEKGLKFYNDLTDAQLDVLTSYGVNHASVIDSIAKSSNVKKAVRIPQFLGFIASGNGALLQASAQTAMLGFCALMIGAKNKNGLNFTVTGKGDENTSDALPSIAKARKVQDFFGVVGVSSAQTQLSVAFSKGGILPTLNLCNAMSKGDNLPVINNNDLSKALIKLITSASDSTIQLWANQSTKNKKAK